MSQRVGVFAPRRANVSIEFECEGEIFESYLGASCSFEHEQLFEGRFLGDRLHLP